MKYNDERAENISLLTIAPRMDLNLMIPICSGAIDVKFIFVKEILKDKNIIHIISRPTNDDQPTFSWKNTTYNFIMPMLEHEGVNDYWNFSWIDYKIQLIKDSNTNKNNNEKGNNTLLLIIIIVGGIIIL